MEDLIFPQRLQGEEIKGLTKREYFAIECLKGFLTSTGMGFTHSDKIINEAIQCADKFIKQLEKK